MLKNLKKLIYMINLCKMNKLKEIKHKYKNNNELSNFNLIIIID